MYITDNIGKRIIITDLDASIKQVAVFVNYSHQDPEFKTIDAELRAYWTDIHYQLQQIKEATKVPLKLPVNLKKEKQIWMLDFLATREDLTEQEQVLDFLHFYGSRIDMESPPQTLFVFEGGYFISMKEDVFSTGYTDPPREFGSLLEAMHYLAELEWQDSVGELSIILDPATTLIESVRTDYTGGNIYNDIVILKDGTVIRISEGVIQVASDAKETTKKGEIFY